MIDRPPFGRIADVSPSTDRARMLRLLPKLASTTSVSPGSRHVSYARHFQKKAASALVGFDKAAVSGRFVPTLCFLAALAIPCRTGTTADQQSSSKIMAEKPSKPYDDRPRAEPEIIPPGAPLRRSRMSGFADQQFTQRIYIRKIGPFGILLLAAAIGIVSVAIFIFLLGAFLFWIPVIGLLLAAGMISGILRTPWRRP